MMDRTQILHRLWPWEADFILWLQSQPDAWITSMRWVSELGHPPFMLTLILFTYWGWKEEAGIQLAKFLTLSGVVMSLSKDLILAPRPFWVHPEIETLGKAGGFGMPSGHAMMACVWLVVLAHTKSKCLKFLGWNVILLTGLSRVSLGLHSPLQVLAGWAFGGLVFGWITLKVPHPKPSPPPNSRELRRELTLLAFLILASLLIYNPSQDWQAPKAWMNVLETKDATVSTIRPSTPKSFLIYLSLYSGLVVWHWARVGLMPKLKLQGNRWQRSSRVSIGVLLGMASYYAYQMMKKPMMDPSGIDYVILGSLCAFATFLLVIGFPWFFQKIRLDSKCKNYSNAKNCSSSSGVL